MANGDCLFCRILEGDIPADIVYESDTAIAFRDINPQAPTHVVIIPRKHIATINESWAACIRPPVRSPGTKDFLKRATVLP